MNHYIIEGPDGAGKTALARWLCHKFNCQYHHEGPPPGTGSVLHHYAGLLANAQHPTVFDRLHLGEIIYGPLLRRTSRLSNEDLKLMNRLIAGLGITVIGCLPEWSTCWANNQSKDELITDQTVMRAAHDGWRVLLHGSRCVNLLLHDYTQHDYPTQLAPPPRLPEGVIGYPEARVLFVGEQPNSKTLDLPFFGTERSSGWLNERIVEAGLDEHALAFTNAKDTAGHHRDLDRIISELPFLQTVVPLGRVAFSAVLNSSVKLRPLPHPSFWKRFHASQSHEYTLMLEGL